MSINKTQTGGFFHFKVGELHLTVVTDGRLIVQRLRPTQTTASSLADQELLMRSQAVDRLLEESFLPVEVIDAALNVLVIRKDENIILIDTGFGYLGYPDTQLPENLLVNQAERRAGKLLQNLIDAGIQPHEVSDIILTHCHIDHLGGLLNAENQPVFENATVHISKIEYDFWMDKNPDFSKSRATDNGPTAVLAYRTLSALQSRLQFLADGDRLFGCLEVIIAPGHTPGQVLVNISSGSEELLHIVDIAYNAELVFPHPEWGANLDIDFQLAIEVRKKYFADLATSRKRAFGSHLPWPGLGYVRKAAKGYEWVPQRFSTPQLF